MPTMYAATAAESAEVAAALVFNRDFRTQAGVNYEWVVKHAREQYAQAEAAFKAADEKAASILTYFGSAAGLFAAGSIAKLAEGQLDPKIALAGVPSFVLAALALIFVALARRPFNVAYQPAAHSAANRANLYGGWHGEAEASLVGAWHLATALVQHGTAKKTGWIASATWMLVCSVATLLLPLVTALVVKW